MLKFLTSIVETRYQATLQGIIIAESSDAFEFDSHYFFPPEDLLEPFFQESRGDGTCIWKGKYHNFDIKIGDKVFQNYAWQYYQVKDPSIKICGYMGFHHDVKVTKKKRLNFPFR